MKFLTSWVTINFCRRTVSHAVSSIHCSLFTYFDELMVMRIIWMTSVSVTGCTKHRDAVYLWTCSEGSRAPRHSAVHSALTVLVRRKLCSVLTGRHTVQQISNIPHCVTVRMLSTSRRSAPHCGQSDRFSIVFTVGGIQANETKINVV